jgi:hypothetical protein
MFETVSWDKKLKKRRLFPLFIPFAGSEDPANGISEYKNQQQKSTMAVNYNIYIIKMTDLPCVTNSL